MSFENEAEYMKSLKGNDNYHFSIPFTYIKKRLGNDEYEDGMATMEVDFTWDESQLGYTVSYFCPDESDIDPAEGNGSIDDFWEYDVLYKAKEELSSYVSIETFAFL